MAQFEKKYRNFVYWDGFTSFYRRNHFIFFLKIQRPEVVLYANIRPEVQFLFISSGRNISNLMTRLIQLLVLS